MTIIPQSTPLYLAAGEWTDEEPHTILHVVGWSCEGESPNITFNPIVVSMDSDGCNPLARILEAPEPFSNDLYAMGPSMAIALESWMAYVREGESETERTLQEVVDILAEAVEAKGDESK